MVGATPTTSRGAASPAECTTLSVAGAAGNLGYTRYAVQGGQVTSKVTLSAARSLVVCLGPGPTNLLAVQVGAFDRFDFYAGKDKLGSVALGCEGWAWRWGMRTAVWGRARFKREAVVPGTAGPGRELIGDRVLFLGAVYDQRSEGSAGGSTGLGGRLYLVEGR